MDAKHKQYTAGPWALHEVGGGLIKHLCPANSEGVSILTVVEDGGDVFAAVFEVEDAHLIAAAPDLLEALKTVIANSPEPYCAITRAVDAQCRAAIAKATGV